MRQVEGGFHAIRKNLNEVRFILFFNGVDDRRPNDLPRRWVHEITRGRSGADSLVLGFDLTPRDEGIGIRFEG
jgi:hypothetical protein